MDNMHKFLMILTSVCVYVPNIVYNLWWDEDEYGTLVEWYFQGKTEVLQGISHIGL